jgi:glycosyltransferase involved in cell wall biosynthesis
MFRRKPLIFDAFLSLYDTVVNDRKLSSPNGLIGRLCFFIDRTACRMADIVLLDTNAHIEYFVKTFQLPREKFMRVFVGADELQFYPKGFSDERLPISPPPLTGGGEGEGERRRFSEETLKVLFYGQFIPLHGIDYIVRAAKILEQDNVEFTIIGKGQEYNKIRNLTDELGVKNIKWIDWVEFHKLVDYINEADVVLGIFGDSEKARRVIPNKAFQSIACKRPLITGDSPAAREIFRDGENALLCRMGDPMAIATSIRLLKDNEYLRTKLGVNGYYLYQSRCNIEAIGKEMRRIFDTIMAIKDADK